MRYIILCRCKVDRKNDINHQVEVQRLLIGGGIGCGDFIASFGEAAAEVIVELAEEKPEMALACLLCS